MNNISTYGFEESTYSYTLPEERRDWRKHIEEHIDEKVDEAVETINANTDAEVATAKETIVNTVNADKDVIVGKINEAVTAVNAHTDAKATEIKNNSNENKNTIIDFIKSWIPKF